MKTSFSLFSLLLLLTCPLFAQPVQTLRGRVTERQTQQPLAGATIALLTTNPPMGTNSDEKGAFRIENVPVGRHEVRVTYLGYETVTLSNLVVTSGKENVLEVQLEEQAFTSETVVISAEGEGNKAAPKNELALVSARQFSVDESRRYAGARDDVSRMAANYAGVAVGNSQRNDIVIRGNSPLGMLWRLDGVDIPNPNHFGGFGASGGPVTMLNNNVLANSDFFTGAFPAQYGNATAGVFDLSMRNGNNEKFEFLGQIGFNGVELGAEGPIGKKGGASFLANYRYSTLVVFQKIGINIGYSGLPYYQDLNFKVNLPSKKGSTQLWGLGGRNHIAFLHEPGSTAGSLTGFGGEQDLYNGGDVAVAGLTHRRSIGTQTLLRLTLSGTYQYAWTRVDTINNNPVDSLGRVYEESFKQNRQAATAELTHKFNARHTLTAGATFNRLGTNFVDSAWVSDYNSYFTLTDFQGSSYLVQGWATSKHKLTSRLTAVMGLYGQHFFLNNEFTLQPRAALQFTLNEFQHLSLAYGHHAQLQQMYVYFHESRQNQNDPSSPLFRTNEDLKSTHSNHLVLGYDLNISKDMRFKAEAYGQYLTGVPVMRAKTAYSLLNTGADFAHVTQDSLINGGNGYNYGLELTVEKFFSKRYYFLATASLFDSRYRGSDSVWRSTAFNTNYVVNLLGGTELPVISSGRGILEISGKVALAGGRRYTPIDLVASALEGEAVYLENKAFSEQFKSYFKADVTIGFRMNMKHYSQRWAFSLENFTGYENPFVQTYDAKTNSLVTENQLGLFPVFQYRIEF